MKKRVKTIPSDVRYGIKVRWPDDHWSWITAADEPYTFATEQQAEEYAEVWRKHGKEHYVKVYPYKEGKY